MFWNLMSMMAATVSSWDLIKVGPNTTPRLATVIMLILLWATTLTRRNNTCTDVARSDGSSDRG